MSEHQWVRKRHTQPMSCVYQKSLSALRLAFLSTQLRCKKRASPESSVIDESNPCPSANRSRRPTCRPTNYLPVLSEETASTVLVSGGLQTGKSGKTTPICQGAKPFSSMKGWLCPSGTAGRPRALLAQHLLQRRVDVLDRKDLGIEWALLSPA